MAASNSVQAPVRRWPGAALCIAAGLALFLMMANEGHVPFATLWGAGLLLLSGGGLLAAMGLFSAEHHPKTVRALGETSLFPLPGERPALAPFVAVPAAILLALAGTLAPEHVSWFIAFGLLLLIPAGLRRPGLLLATLLSLLYLPLLGTYGLWDPWETHYGEVAREILARDDWISLWWAQDGWFWSKPILIFWSEALTWNALGMDYLPDTHFSRSEWALRLPVYGFSMLAVAAVYQWIKSVFSARAGLVAGLCLGTTPFFALLSHQAITDPYFVANLTIAMMCLLGAITTAKNAETRGVRIGQLVFSGQHMVIALLFVIAVPQLLYLASRNVALVDGFLFAWHGDDFASGSAFNDGVPGNNASAGRLPVYRRLPAQPMALAVYFMLGFAYLVFALRKERNARTLLMAAFYTFCALAFMGKGLPGFALPGLVALLWLLAHGRFARLVSGQLLVWRGGLTIAVLGLPWFVAMYTRHGNGFTDRLVVHDHINRLTSGVHGDKGSIQYFITHLGYGLFPWVGLAPLALAYAMSRRAVADEADGSEIEVDQKKRQREGVEVLVLWFVAAFTLFTAMTTKFHHYIFPAVPAAAILIGLALNSFLGKRRDVKMPLFELGIRPWLGAACIALGVLCWVTGFGSIFGDLRGIVPEGVGTAGRAVWVFQNSWPVLGSLACIALGVSLFAVAMVLQKDTWQNVADGPEDHSELGGFGLVAGLLCGAIMAAFIGRDLSWSTEKGPIGSERLIQLFIYKYDRPFPDHIDYRPLFSGFAVVFVCLLLMMVWRRVRPQVGQGMLAFGLIFCGFVLNVYLVDLSPHWSQRELVEKYYAQRSGPEQPLVAWQMNWKGENYYTGNRVSVFQALDNKKVKKFIEGAKGSRAFFILEHKRLGRFEKLLKPRKVERLSTKRDGNKFILVRADL